MGNGEAQEGASRRAVLRGGALGMGAVVGTMGLTGGAVAAAAKTPRVAVAATSSGTDQIFFQMDGIGGESTDPRHRGQIDVLSFSWGATGAATAGGTNPNVSDFSLALPASKASPLLFQACVTGHPVLMATIRVARNGDATDYLKFTLNNVTVDSYQQSDSGEGSAIESVSLKFTKITYSFAPQRADLSYGPPIVVIFQDS